MNDTLSQIAQPALRAVTYLQQSRLPIPSTGPAYGILKGAILAAGFLIVLDFPVIFLAPLLTALGVGGLAVALALALQDTLSNHFAGLPILIEKTLEGGGRDPFPQRTVHIHEAKI
jgi:small-conductance mechanosensitive channel